jgi:glutamine amidotransferase
MCRLLGIVSRDARGYARCLRDSPSSLGVLGRAHGDGWGIAIHEEKTGWIVTKQPTSAAEDPRFAAAAAEATGTFLVAHVRKRTVGGVSHENTHPFRRGPWVFAHNGTLERVDTLRAMLDEPALADIRGQTDSEVLFAFLLARLGSHPTAASSQFVADMLLARAIEDLSGIPSLGAATFVLSDGAALYAYCHGRPLFLLHRRESTGVEAILVASERVTPEEPWTAIAEGTLVVAWRHPRLGWAVMRKRSATPPPGREP